MFLLKMLGSLSLQGDPAPVPPGAQQKRRLSLLALLAVAGKRGISRDRLQCFLWPESNASRSRHALDQLVYATRRALGADPIIIDARDLRLDVSIIATDIHRFEEAIRNNCLAAAAAMYGGPLLDGIHLSDSRELESYLDSERNRLEQQYQKALRTLAQESQAVGDHAGSVEWWRKLADSDPLSSIIAAGMMEAMSATGNRAAAILHGRSYQQLVRSELEIEPDPGIERLIVSLAAPRASKVESMKVRKLERPRTDHDAPHAGDTAISTGAVDAAGFTSSPKRRRLIPRTVTLALLAVAAPFILTRDFGKNPIARVEGTSAISPEARATYLRGLNAWNDRSPESLDTAVVYFRNAIEMEPLYAEAYAGLANAYVMLGYSGYRPADAMFPKAKAAALRSIELDSTLAAPYAALGMELTWERHFNAAEPAYLKAIALDPGYATAHQWYGILLMILGKKNEAVAETGKAAELDPFSLQIQNNHATFLHAAGFRAEARRHYQKMVNEEPDSAWVRRNPWLLTNLAAVYAADRQFEKALRLARQAVDVIDRHPRSLSALAGVYYAMGQPDSARATLARADTANEHYPAYRAFQYVKEGNLDSAFIWFDRVRQWAIPVMISMQNQPTLSRDPRYAALLRRLGMPVVISGDANAGEVSLARTVRNR